MWCALHTDSISQFGLVKFLGSRATPGWWWHRPGNAGLGHMKTNPYVVRQTKRQRKKGNHKPIPSWGQETLEESSSGRLPAQPHPHTRLACPYCPTRSTSSLLPRCCPVLSYGVPQTGFTQWLNRGQASALRRCSGYDGRWWLPEFCGQRRVYNAQLQICSGSLPTLECSLQYSCRKEGTRWS